MPTTNYSWPVGENLPIFQVFGTKRKLEPAGCGDEDAMSITACKRQCNEQFNEPVEYMETVYGERTDVATYLTAQHPMATFGEESQKLCVSYTLSTAQSQIPDHTGDYGNNNNNPIIESFGHELNNNNNGNFHISASAQHNMTMDLNYEAYSKYMLSGNPATNSSHGVTCSTKAASVSERPNCHLYDMAFCDQYCIGGSRSPSSGKVRCMCKLSWEGLTDMRPYVSDYY